MAFDLGPFSTAVASLEVGSVEVVICFDLLPANLSHSMYIMCTADFIYLQAQPDCMTGRLLGRLK